MDFKNKKLLILGGNSLSCEIIKEAKKNGAYVIVTDYLENSPGKIIADKSFMISTTDVEAVVDLIKKEKVDGILTGFIDSMLPYYVDICSLAKVPCYLTKEHVDITTNKIKFKNLCKKFNVPVVEDYELSYPLKQEEIDKIKYPVLIKPIDNSGGRGIFICENSKELLLNYEKSLEFSPSKTLLVERYMECKEVTIFYLIQNGNIVLSSMADRYVKNKQKGIIPLPVGYIFPSVFLDNFQETLNSKVIQMFKYIGVKDGMIFIQSFVENNQCIIYEMGYRLTGSLEYKIINELNGINPMKLMINYALNNEMTDLNIEDCLNPNYETKGCNITLLAKPGQIKSIKGINEVKKMDEVIDIVCSYMDGDIIPETALGTLSQVIIRIFFITDNLENLKNTIKKIYSIISVTSINDENMLLDVLNVNEIM